MRLLAISLLGLTLLTARAYAQTAHYWTDQYGSRSRLLGGAVIGSVDDLAAVYYNPARLALNPRSWPTSQRQDIPIYSNHGQRWPWSGYRFKQ